MMKLSINIRLIVFCLSFIFVKLESPSQIECSSQKGLWFSKKFPYSDELMKFPMTKSADKLCPKNICCDTNIQNEMIGVSQFKLKSIAELHMKEIVNFLLNNSDRFNDYFQNNLDSSRNQLHQMFLSTYSTSYKLNQPFFFEFYEKLKQYMIGKEQNVEKILDNFFHDMAERILNMMVLPKKDPETIRCLTNNFLKLDPFQNIDKAIINSFKTAYPVARMLVNSMKAAHDVFQDLMEKKMMPSLECAEAHAKAFHCSLCSTAELLPCEGLCKSIMGKCFGSLNAKEMTKLFKSWKKLLAAMVRLSERLKRPFNFPETNKNLHVKISDAIMNVHNFYPTVRDKISGRNCDNQITRMRRAENGNYNQHFESVPSFSDSLNQRSPDLPEIIEKFTTMVPNITLHLQKSKYIICQNLNLPKTGKSCWNGVESATNYKAEPKGKDQIKSLPIDPIVRSSIDKLNEITMILNNLMTEKNKDPNAFKIKYVEKPKKVEIPRTRASRVSESVEGSGNGDRETSNYNSNPNIRVKPEALSPPVPKEKPVDIIEGSGSKKAPVNTPNTKGRPAFPEVPVTGENQPSNQPVKKPSISDDEDLAPDNNEKDKTNSQFQGKKTTFEGSGSQENVERSTEPVQVTTTTTTTQIPVTETKRPANEFRASKEPNLSEGSGQGPDDDPPQNKPEDYSMMPIMNVPTTTTSIDETATTGGTALPSELPGEIPNEIWIPRVVDYDSFGKVVSNQRSKASNISLGAITFYFMLFVSVYIYILK